MRRRTMFVLALVAALAVLAAACGGGSSKKSKSTTTTSKSQPSTTAAAAGPATVKVGDSSLGKVLVGADGKTLYLYMPDMGTTSAVPANILPNWPPVMAMGKPVGGDGVDGSKLSTAPQSNGQTWVAYNGHLLYAFKGDTAPGDTKGQGLGNVWYAVSPAGNRIG